MEEQQNYEMNKEEKDRGIRSYAVRDFVPLLTIFAIIIGSVLVHQIIYGWDVVAGMRIMMAAFFLILGFFKVINLSGFVQAYRIYDLIAQRFAWYGYAYPFIELALGAAYLANWRPALINSITLVIMLVSAAGVFNELRKGKQITCACLGAVFTVPMTYVTLVEDLLMAAMAATMLLL